MAPAAPILLSDSYARNQRVCDVCKCGATSQAVMVSVSTSPLTFVSVCGFRTGVGLCVHLRICVGVRDGSGRALGMGLGKTTSVDEGASETVRAVGSWSHGSRVCGFCGSA